MLSYITTARYKTALREQGLSRLEEGAVVKGLETAIVVAPRFEIEDVVKMTPTLLSRYELPENTERAVLMTISDESRDRDGDRILAKGWDLKSFSRNPVVPFAHDTSSLPVARALRVWVDSEAKTPRLRAIKQFAPADVWPFANAVFRMIELGYLSAASVGFMPKKAQRDPELSEDQYGIVYEKQELMESSIVPVPSNPSALIEARGKGVDVASIVPWTERVLDTKTSELYGVSTAQVEEARKTITGSSASVVVPAPIEPDASSAPNDLAKEIEALKSRLAETEAKLDARLRTVEQVHASLVFPTNRDADALIELESDVDNSENDESLNVELELVLESETEVDPNDLESGLLLIEDAAEQAA